MLKILLRAFVVQPVDASAYSICHLIIGAPDTSSNVTSISDNLIVVNDISVKTSFCELVFTTLRDTINEADKNKEEEVHTFIEAFLQVARAPVTSMSRGRYVPALLISSKLYNEFPPSSPNSYTISDDPNSERIQTDENVWRKDFVDLLGRRIFALGGGARPATKDEVHILSPLIKSLSKVEFDGAMVRPLKFKLLADLDGTIETLCAFVSILVKEKKGFYVHSHLKGATNLIGNAIKQITRGESERQTLGTDLLLLLIRASPSLETLEIIVSQITAHLQPLFDSDSDGKRKCLYNTCEQIASFLRDDKLFFQKLAQHEKTKFVNDSLSYLTTLAEKESNFQNPNELCICALKKAVDVWSGLGPPSIAATLPPRNPFDQSQGQAINNASANVSGTGLSTSLLKSRTSMAPRRGSGPGVQSVGPNGVLNDPTHGKMARSASGSTNIPGVATAVSNLEDRALHKSSRAGLIGSTTGTPPLLQATTFASDRGRQKSAYGGLASSSPNVVATNLEDRGMIKSARNFPLQPPPRRNSNNFSTSLSPIDNNNPVNTSTPAKEMMYEQKDSKPIEKLSAQQPEQIQSKNYSNYEYSKVDEKLEGPHKVDDDTPYCGLVQSGGVQPTTDQGLVTAMAVDVDDITAPLTFAQAYDENEKIPLHKNRRVITYTIGALLVFVIGAVGMTLVMTKNVAEQMAPTMAPTSQPTSPPTSLRDRSGIWERLSHLSGEEILLGLRGVGPEYDAYRKTPQFKAANWIINEDKRQLTVDDHLLEQRYILAVIYFSTHGDTWTHCAHKPGDLDTNCTYFDTTYQDNFTESRYLSEAHECKWFQTYCSEDNVLRELLLYENNLKGSIPTEIAQLSKLRRLRLNANKLTSTLPSELGQMKHLADLEVHGNELEGTFPPEIFELDTLQLLNIAINRFTGTIPDKFDHLKNMKGIHMFRNKFEGSIPETLGEMPFLTFVFLDNNHLTGTIPDSIYSVNRLKQLQLQNNRLTGTLSPKIGNIAHLERLMINENDFSGDLPEELYELRKLDWLYLHSNKFTGTISKKIGQLKDLKRLLFRFNKFSGTIPSSIGDLKNLEYLWFHFNGFTGTVPEEVCSLTNVALSSLMADCLADYQEASLTCSCCTDCCDRTQETCYKET